SPKGVEAERDQDEIRCVAAHGGLNDLLENARVDVVAGAGRQRNVEGVALAWACTSFAPEPSPWVERVLMRRNVQDVCPRIEGVLRSVPVMDVVVENGDALGMAVGQQPLG